jgi:hypothetical protein
MRPTRILGFAAALVVASLATFAQADGSKPPTSAPPAPLFSVSGGSITVTAQGSTHVNSGFPWKFLDGGGNKVKQASDFTFSGGTKDAPMTANVTGVPASGTLRGAYCDPGNCYTFTAACTAAGCTITGI